MAASKQAHTHYSHASVWLTQGYPNQKQQLIEAILQEWSLTWLLNTSKLFWKKKSDTSV